MSQAAGCPLAFQITDESPSSSSIFESSAEFPTPTMIRDIG